MIVLVSLVALAQPAQAAGPLTLGHAMDLALIGSHDLEAALLALESAALGSRRSWGKVIVRP